MISRSTQWCKKIEGPLHQIGTFTGITNLSKYFMIG